MDRAVGFPQTVINEDRIRITGASLVEVFAQVTSLGRWSTVQSHGGLPAPPIRLYVSRPSVVVTVTVVVGATDEAGASVPPYSFGCNGR